MVSPAAAGLEVSARAVPGRVRFAPAGAALGSPVCDVALGSPACGVRRSRELSVDAGSLVAVAPFDLGGGEEDRGSPRTPVR